MTNYTGSLTYAQLEAANKLYSTLENWKIGTSTFSYLKPLGFEKEEVCLLIVVAIDSLYSTSLRFHAGLRERIATHIRVNRDALETRQGELAQPKYVVDFAKQFAVSDGDGPISFASKFFHFFVSDNLPIFDKYAFEALKRITQSLGYKAPKKNYVSFCECAHTLCITDNRITVSALDKYLWLMGQLWDLCESEKNWEDTVKKVKERKTENEVLKLFVYPTRAQEAYLDGMVGGKFNKAISANWGINLTRVAARVQRT
jgi:hypothetical protein